MFQYVQVLVTAESIMILILIHAIQLVVKGIVFIYIIKLGGIFVILLV